MSTGTQSLDEPVVANEPLFETDAVMQKAAVENFSVASRLLPKKYRDALLGLYGYARFVDDIGDLADGDRAQQLDWAEAELDRAFSGTATHPVFVALSPVVRSIKIDRTPFINLILANRQDQVVKRYETYDELAQYCALSANPVGRIVLAIFDRSDERTIVRSDEVCTALQLVEHWQDVKEDFEVGRIYLPLEDLEAFSVPENELGNSMASPAFRRLMTFEVGRARTLFHSGAPLVSMLNGAAKLAISGFVGGGIAQLNAIEKSSYDVLAAPVKASKMSVAIETSRTYRHRGLKSV